METSSTIASFKTFKGAFHNFLRGLGQRPITYLPALMLNGKLKVPVNVLSLI